MDTACPHTPFEISARFLPRVAPWLLLAVASVPLMATDRVFVLSDAGQLRQYKIDAKRVATLEHSYAESELPGALPAAAISVESGNRVRTYDAQGALHGELLLDPQTNLLATYSRQPGDVASHAGRILEAPDTSANFRGANSLYAVKKDASYLAGLLREKILQTVGRRYRDVFVLDGIAYGTNGDHIERLSNREGIAVTGDTAVSLAVPNARLGRAVVSPWGEAFISDAGNHALQRVVWRNGGLEVNGTVADAAMVDPGALAFDPDGELFVATGSKGAKAILRYGFVLEGFTQWRPVPRGTLDLGDASARDLALARPAGFVISEAVKPLVSVVTGAGNAHHGISQAVFLSPEINSETAVIALVQYEPGGFTVVHQHSQMEQVEIVVAGRALWEVGEFEREVGPGDVVFCPRNVKHGYRVIGDKPFKFYQVEWREWAINH